MTKKSEHKREDTRPWEVYDPNNEESKVVRCWYESTAKDYVAKVGTHLKVRKREVAR
jgi:hypothetical protein